MDKDFVMKAKPIKVTRGNTTVKIYPVENEVKGVVYRQFVLTYKLGTRLGKNGKVLPLLVRKKFTDLEKAKFEAGIVASKLASGQAEVLNLTGPDRDAYLNACHELRPLNISLTHAVSQFVKASRMLPPNFSIIEAVEFFLRRNPANMPKKSVREVVEEMIAAKTKAGRGDKHLVDLQSRLGRFADAMQKPIIHVTSDQVVKHLDGLNVSPRTWRNHLRHISTLFRYATRKKYLSIDALDEIAVIEKPDHEDGEIAIFSVEEMNEILTYARPEIIPWLAIGAFSGLRHAELQRLDWSEVDLIHLHIEVTAAKSKTASRRLAPIPINLMAWLKKYAHPGGRVTGFENVSKQIGWLVQDVNKRRRENAKLDGRDPDKTRKFKWKRNGLRHSFISYRVAAVKDVARVALEAGNSPAMVFANYRQLVTDHEAEQWFNILPPDQVQNGENESPNQPKINATTRTP